MDVLARIGQHFIDFLTNYILISGISAWMLAQLLKIPVELYKHKRDPRLKWNVSRIVFGNGGMPSSHTATVCSVACAALLRDGAHSTSFAICCVFAIIVMNDAVGVRRETGDQAKLLNRITSEMPSEMLEDLPPRVKDMKEMVGHTPMQVFMGALLGITVAIILHFIPAFDLQPFIW